MTVKQAQGLTAPDGSRYVTITDGAGNLGESGVPIGAVSQSGTWTVQPGNTANTTAWKVDGSAVTQPVSLPTSPATGTITSVASSATDVSVLASNANRKGASVYNDSTQILYLACSNATSSTSVYTIQVASNAFFELPPCRDGSVYTGVLKGIWASANGNARVTEWT